MSANLNPEEISALMSAIEDGRVNPEPQAPRSQVIPYDLTSRERLLQGQMPALDSIHEQIAAAFGSGLSGRTRLPLRVESSPGTLIALADLGLLLAAPATVCVLDLDFGGAEAVVILEPGLAETLVFAALGNRMQEEPAAASELTPVGKLVLRKLIELLGTAMANAWAPYLPLHPTVSRFETDPRLAVRMAPGGDVAILTSFNLRGPIAGRIQLALPYTAIQPAKRLLHQAASSARVARGDLVRAAMAAEVEATEVELRAELGRTSLSLAKLLELEEGDLLPLGSDEGSPLPLLVQGREKLLGFPLVVRGGLALRLEGGLGAPPHAPEASTGAPHSEAR